MKEFLQAVEDHLCVSIFVAVVAVAILGTVFGRGR